MGMIDGHIAALPSGRPGVQHLMIDGVKHIDSAKFPHRSENTLAGSIQENLARMSFYDDVAEKFVASSVKDPHSPVIEARELRPIPEVKILLGGIINDAVHSQFKLY